jgi:hypothetical protein
VSYLSFHKEQSWHGDEVLAAINHPPMSNTHVNKKTSPVGREVGEVAFFNVETVWHLLVKMVPNHRHPLTGRCCTDLKPSKTYFPTKALVFFKKIFNHINLS